MEPKEHKIRIAITEQEIEWLAHIMDHFTDYMSHDDRPDHGLGILKQYRELPQEQKREVYVVAGLLLRTRKKLRDKRYKEKTANEI